MKGSIIVGNSAGPLGRVELDAETARLEQCCASDGRPLQLKSPCHRRSGLRAFYQDGKFFLLCGECDSMVLALWVGEAPRS